MKKLFAIILVITLALSSQAQKITRLILDGKNVELITSNVDNNYGSSISTSQTRVKTFLCDNHTNTPLVGGVIINCNVDNVAAKLLIVSLSKDNLSIMDGFPITNPYDYAKANIPTSYRIIDCSNINKEQFFCYLKALEPNTKYYIRSVVIFKDSSMDYGNVITFKTPNNFNRMKGKMLDFANVWNKELDSQFTLHDLVTDEIINTNKGYVYSSNEHPTPKKIIVKGNKVYAYNSKAQKGCVTQKISQYWNTCYKFSNEWNYLLWLTHAKHLINNEDDIVDEPTIVQNGGNIEMFCGINETVHYEINQKEPTKPYEFTKTYTKPFKANRGDIIKAYSINNFTNFISYTNVFVVQ